MTICDATRRKAKELRANGLTFTEIAAQLNISRPSAKTHSGDNSGCVKGSRHPNAKLSDHEVELIRQLYEDHNNTLSYRDISQKFEISRNQVGMIVRYESRV